MEIPLIILSIIRLKIIFFCCFLLKKTHNACDSLHVKGVFIPSFSKVVLFSHVVIVCFIFFLLFDDLKWDFDILKVHNLICSTTSIIQRIIACIVKVLTINDINTSKYVHEIFEGMIREPKLIMILLNFFIKKMCNCVLDHLLFYFIAYRCKCCMTVYSW